MSGQTATLISLEERVSKPESLGRRLSGLEQDQRELSRRVTSFTGPRPMSVDSFAVVADDFHLFD